MKSMRFLWVALIGAVVLCVAAFAWLTDYMVHQNEKTIGDVSEMCLEQTGVQLGMHFDTAMELRQSQLRGMAARCLAAQGTDGGSGGARNALAERAASSRFGYVALYSADGARDVVHGGEVSVDASDSFLDGLAAGDQRYTSAIDANGETLILLGVSAAFPMANGAQSAFVVAGFPLDELVEELSLDVGETLVYSHIIRFDGSFVLHSESASENTQHSNYFERVRQMAVGSQKSQETLRELEAAMARGESYSLVLNDAGIMRNIYLAPLEHTDWYIVSVLPQDLVGNPVHTLVNQRTYSTLIGCAVVLLIIIACFVLYFRMTRRHLAQVEAARREADAANQAKSAFLSNMSHDIRTPMNAIVGLAEVAAAKPNDQAVVNDCLHKIRLSSRHLLGLINDVLDMSKIESGKLTLSTGVVSLDETVDNVVGIIRSQIKERNLRFDVHVGDIVSESVYCDGVRLNQVLLNLLSNAVKFTPEGGQVALSVSQRPSQDGDARVTTVFRVRDTGIGMSPEFQERMFESFEREARDNVHQTEGTGLGMAIVKSIVDKMGGTIEVQSALGQGTAFTITLDFDRADAVVEKSAQPSADVQSIDGKRVLLAEDQALNWEVARALLSAYGLELAWAHDGKECVEMFAASAEGYYDAILMDVQMPVMDGYEATRAIRALSRADAGNVPIVAMTANVFAQDIEESLACGMNAHASKPIDAKQLALTLAGLIDGRE